MEQKTDMMRECITDPSLVNDAVPIDEFQKQYCIRCIQQECTRSIASKSSFNRRVENWEKDLFQSPPRASETDPSFETIRNKVFAQSGSSPSPKVQVFVSGFEPVKNLHVDEPVKPTLETNEEPKETAVVQVPLPPAQSSVVCQAPVTGIMIQRPTEVKETAAETVSESGSTYTFE
jgi:hypothetical protein